PALQAEATCSIEVAAKPWAAKSCAAVSMIRTDVSAASSFGGRPTRVLTGDARPATRPRSRRILPSGRPGSPFAVSSPIEAPSRKHGRGPGPALPSREGRRFPIPMRSVYYLDVTVPFAYTGTEWRLTRI